MKKHGEYIFKIYPFPQNKESHIGLERHGGIGGGMGVVHEVELNAL